MNTNLNVLIVEDIQAVALKAQIDLVSIGYQCTLAHSGQKALAILTQHDFDTFSHMILDFNLPDMTGLELLDHLPHQLVRQLKITLISAETIPSQILKSYCNYDLDIRIKNNSPNFFRAIFNEDKVPNEDYENLLKSYCQSLQDFSRSLDQNISHQTLKTELHKFVGSSNLFGFTNLCHALKKQLISLKNKTTKKEIIVKKIQSSISETLKIHQL